LSSAPVLARQQRHELALPAADETVRPGVLALFRVGQLNRFLRRVSGHPCSAEAASLAKICVLEPMRQVGLVGRRREHDAAARQGVDAVGERQRLLDQLLDQ